MASMNGHMTNINKNLKRVEGKVNLLLHDRLQGENTDNQIEANLIEEPNKFELKKEPEIEIIEPPKMKRNLKKRLKKGVKQMKKEKIYLQEKLIFISSEIIIRVMKKVYFKMKIKIKFFFWQRRKGFS